MTNPEIARFALAFLGTYALHSTLLLAAVWALCASRPSLAPRLRERLWRLGIVDAPPRDQRIPVPLAAEQGWRRRRRGHRVAVLDLAPRSEAPGGVRPVRIALDSPGLGGGGYNRGRRRGEEAQLLVHGVLLPRAHVQRPPPFSTAAR